MILGEGSGTIHADALGVGTQMPPARQAISTAAANHVAFPADPIPRMEVGDICAHLNDFANKLVPNDQGHGDGLLRPCVPLVDVEIGSANTGCQGRES